MDLRQLSRPLNLEDQIAQEIRAVFYKVNTFRFCIGHYCRIRSIPLPSIESYIHTMKAVELHMFHMLTPAPDYKLDLSNGLASYRLYEINFRGRKDINYLNLARQLLDGFVAYDVEQGMVPQMNHKRMECLMKIFRV